MRQHLRFIWDESKALQNLRKHEVSFVDTAEVLRAPFFEVFHLDELDAAASNRAREDRWNTTGSHPLNRQLVLRVTWTERLDEAGQLTRIISARPLTRRERKAYEKEVQERGSSGL